MNNFETETSATLHSSQTSFILLYNDTQEQLKDMYIYSCGFVWGGECFTIWTSRLILSFFFPWVVFHLFVIPEMKTSRIQDFIACVNDAGSIDTTSDKMGVEIRFVFMCRISCWWIGTCTQMGLSQVNMKEKCVFTFTQFKLHKDLKMDFFASDYLCPPYSPASKKWMHFIIPYFLLKFLIFLIGAVLHIQQH